MKFPVGVKCLVVGVAAVAVLATTVADERIATDASVVRCGNLIYGNSKTSVCFSSEFLSQIRKDSFVTADPKLYPVKLQSVELYQYPFCVMTGEGRFVLTPDQQDNMRNYLLGGGFIIASAGCSDKAWVSSFRREIARVFPNIELQRVDNSHPIYHTVYDIKKLDIKKPKRAGTSEGYLEGLEIDGKIVLIFTQDGLNDSGKVSDDCCCCGGNEIRNAREINVNLLAYTLTH